MYLFFDTETTGFKGPFKNRMTQLAFKLIDENKQKELLFAAYNTNADVLDFSIIGPNISLKMRNMNFVENRGLEIVDLSTDFIYTRKYMNFDRTILKTDNKSKITGGIKLTYNRKDFKNFNDKVNFKAKLSKSEVSVKDLSKLYKELKGNDVLYFTGDVFGVLNNFSANNIKLYSKKGMKIIGDMGFVNAIKTTRYLKKSYA